MQGTTWFSEVISARVNRSLYAGNTPRVDLHASGNHEQKSSRECNVHHAHLLVRNKSIKSRNSVFVVAMEG